MSAKADPTDPSERLSDTLSSLPAICAQVSGAAVATSDGLALAVTGELRGDEAAAAAVFLMDELEAHLGLIRQGRIREMLAWTERGHWYLTRVGDLPFVLVLGAEPASPAGLLRHAGQAIIPELIPVLQGLDPF
ncbi:MAG: hypothetical protein C4K60_14865 [Ideonella sp. MAG2]|nr:MAG: hypothetical protein C4K60_14865 [Ideonella sp. MAG2]